MDDNFFTEKELKSANRGSIAPVVVVIFVIIALLGLAFFGGKYYLASRNNIKIFMNDYFNKLEDNIGKNNSTSGSLSLNVNGDTTDKEKKIFKILNNLDFSMNYGIDTKENITNIDISTNYYGDKLININTYIEDNNIYLLFFIFIATSIINKEIESRKKFYYYLILLIYYFDTAIILYQF